VNLPRLFPRDVLVKVIEQQFRPQSWDTVADKSLIFPLLNPYSLPH
jgi:hypothetical protein